MDALINFLPAPINSFSWTVGGIVVLIYGMRGWRAWKASPNQFSKYFALMGIFAGIGLLFYGSVALVGASTGIVFLAMLTGLILVDIGLFMQSLFPATHIKSIFLRRFYQVALLLSGGLSILAMVDGGYIEETATLTMLVLPPAAVYLQSLFLALALFPTSFIFYQKAQQYTLRRIKVRSMVFSVSYITLGGLAIANYIINQNRETEATAVANLLLFLAFGLFALVLTRYKSTSK